MTILSVVAGQKHKSSINTEVTNAKHASGESGFKAHQVCDLFDISKATLFRWERDGVITQPARDWRNWRLYKRKNVDEIEKVIRARKAVM